jgi:hypothetical protein
VIIFINPQKSGTMKKLKLNLHHIESSQVLTREQLKKVLGGMVNVTTPGNCTISKACSDGKTVSCNGNGSACKSITCETGAAGVQCNEDDAVCCAVDEG